MKQSISDARTSTNKNANEIDNSLQSELSYVTKPTQLRKQGWNKANLENHRQQNAS